MAPIWDKMKRKHLNTVIAPVYWELLEPSEGKFDFSLVDSMLCGVRAQDLHLVILWFGSWKNGYSTYVPAWIKNNTAKYARAKDKDGNSFEMLSGLYPASQNADAKAFKVLMHHIKEVGSKYQTVIAIQVENEIGLFKSPRDYGKLANEAYERGVPADLMKYLYDNKSKLQPELDSARKANGYKMNGSWEDVFGKSKFEAMYVNAWITQPSFHYPGKYPSGGPIPHTLDVWRAAAPAIDFISPDIYVPSKVDRHTMEQYRRSGNPLFIPEIRPGAQSASEAFWAYGQLDAIAFSPFGIDDLPVEEDEITKTYEVLNLVNR